MKVKLLVSLISVLISTLVVAQTTPAPTKNGTRVGDVFLDYAKFDAKTIDGKSIATKDFKGKYLFIDFWATWCPPCEGEFPFLSRVEKKLVGDKFMMFGISLDNDINKIEPFKKKYGVTYPNIADGKGWNSPWAAKYDIKSIPSNFLLDPDGKIIAIAMRGYDVEYKVAKALGIESPIVYIFDAEEMLNDDKDEDRVEKATQNIEKALKLEPDIPEGYEKLGDIHLDLNQDAKAREEYSKAMKNLDKSPDQYLVYRLHEKVAETYAGEKNWDAVIAEYGKIKDLLKGPQKISAQAGLVRVLDKYEMKESAVAQRKIMLAMFKEQSKDLQEQYAQYIQTLEGEIKKLEEELSGKGKEKEKEGDEK